MATALEKWQAVTQRPEVVSFFRDTFDRIGVRVVDGGEALTCIHRGDRIDFEPTLNEAAVDYTIEIETFQVDRLAEEATKPELSELEQFRVLKEVFTPATAATLEHPVLASGLLRRLSRVEDLIHVRLRSPAPDQEEDATHTLAHVAGQWLVSSGLHGKPGRTFTLSVDDAREYQRQVRAAVKANSAAGWLRFSRWYTRWRKGVSVTS